MAVIVSTSYITEPFYIVIGERIFFFDLVYVWSEEFCGL